MPSDLLEALAVTRFLVKSFGSKHQATNID